MHTPRTSANGMNHTCLCLPSRSWYSLTDPGEMEGWVGLGLPSAMHNIIIIINSSSSTNFLATQVSNETSGPQ